MSERILEMRGIEKSFFGVPVLKKVDFSLDRGSVHAIVGGNGAGKSTLMKILTGVYSKDAGEIVLEGRAVEVPDYSAASRLGIRMIFQELSDIPTMRVWENIFLNNELRRSPLLDKAEMRRRTRELLERFGIDIDPDAVMSGLSVGFCQMIEIAKALSRNAKILVMDEPTASLSASEVVVLFTLIDSLREQGVSVVYISHRMGEILRVADAITVLRDGEIAVSRSTEGLGIDEIVGHVLGSGERNQMEWHENLYSGPEEELLKVESLCVDERIRDLSFSVRRGEILGLAGLLGSGRTEILEAIFGIRPTRSGQVRVGKQVLSGRNAQDAINKGVALVSEDRRREGLVLIHTVKQNLVLPIVGRLRRGPLVDGKRATAVTEESIRSLNIKTSGPDAVVKRLSGGNQQKVVVAKWLRTNPKVLLLDEPTAGIDIGAKGEILDIIRRYANEGNAVVLVSSELSELLAVSDRILVLHDGRVAREYRHSEIESEEVIEHAIQV